MALLEVDDLRVSLAGRGGGIEGKFESVALA